MTDRERLLKAILAHPEEDAPRLMYADEIEADEPDRAEFIRVQCELHTVRCEWSEYVYCWNTTYSEADLLATGCLACRAAWPVRKREMAIDPACLDAEVNALVAWGVRPSWSRGFVEAVTCGGDDWERHGDAILARHPVRKVTFTDCGPAVEHRDDYRQYLSRRWPRIPPDGWAFAPTPAAPLVTPEDFTYLGAYRPPESQVLAAFVDDNGDWHVAVRTEDGQVATAVYTDPFAGT